jgi:hypothetical protein
VSWSWWVCVFPTLIDCSLLRFGRWRFHCAGSAEYCLLWRRVAWQMPTFRSKPAPPHL